MYRGDKEHPPKMNSHVRTISADGRVTIPFQIRRVLDIKEGDYVEFRTGNNERIIMRKMKPANSTAGILNHLAKRKPIPVSRLSH